MSKPKGWPAWSPFYTKEVKQVGYNPIDEKEIDELIENENKTKKTVMIIICLFVCFLVLKNKAIFKDYEYVEDFSHLPDPIQEEYSGEVIKTIDHTDFDIKFIAKYSISGLAVDVQKYFDFEYGKLSPVDVGMSWGFLVDENDRIHWYSKGTRFLHFETKDVKWYRSISYDEINKHFSNNHLIPCDEKVMKLCKNIKKGDFIKIEGYLVRSSWQDEKRREYRWNSSTSREDKGDGACEIIYVTSVKWLKEK